jgi:hypothetical protein
MFQKTYMEHKTVHWSGTFAFMQVHLNWPVVRVEYTEDKGVRLWSQDGSTICADYLILTLPMKILQECIVEFDPPLPPSKLKSIQSIGMRNALKVLSLHFIPLGCGSCSVHGVGFFAWISIWHHQNNMDFFSDF